jgi:hypothetical protein
MNNSDWDIDLRYGKLGESKVADLLSLKTVEVKTDRRWKETGNLYIETECYYVKDNSWKPSGVRVSKASHWAFVLESSVLIIPTDILKEVVWHSNRPITCNIPPNPSRGYLVTPAQLLEQVKQLHVKLEQELEEHLAEQWVDPAERDYPS